MEDKTTLTPCYCLRCNISDFVLIGQIKNNFLLRCQNCGTLELLFNENSGGVSA